MLSNHKDAYDDCIILLFTVSTSLLNVSGLELILKFENISAVLDCFYEA